MTFLAAGSHPQSGGKREERGEGALLPVTQEEERGRAAIREVPRGEDITRPNFGWSSRKYREANVSLNYKIPEGCRLP